MTYNQTHLVHCTMREEPGYPSEHWIGVSLAETGHTCGKQGNQSGKCIIHIDNSD